ncbi:MAG: hypothetical protein ACR2ME_06205 [Acidimicrobiia bacterium]
MAEKEEGEETLKGFTHWISVPDYLPVILRLAEYQLDRGWFLRVVRYEQSDRCTIAMPAKVILEINSGGFIAALTSEVDELRQREGDFAELEAGSWLEPLIVAYFDRRGNSRTGFRDPRGEFKF